jgi:hypothetical protein
VNTPVAVVVKTLPVLEQVAVAEKHLPLLEQA